LLSGGRCRTFTFRQQSRGSGRLLNAVIGGEVVDVFDESDHATCADLALIGGHNRRVCLGDGLRGIENCIADESFVCELRLAVGERELRTVDIGEVRTTGVRASVVACGTAKAGEQALSVLRERCAARGTGEPVLVVVGSHDDDITDHVRVVSAAVLGAEQVIRAGCCGLKPNGGVATRNGLTLYAEGGNRETVEDVLGNKGELNSATCRNVERINFVLTTGVLCLPHPLLADDIDIHSVGGRSVDAEVDERAPDKHDEEEAERNDSPGGLAHGGALDLYGNRVVLLPVHDGESSDEQDDDGQTDKADQHHEEEQSIRLRSDLGG